MFFYLKFLLLLRLGPLTRQRKCTEKWNVFPKMSELELLVPFIWVIREISVSIQSRFFLYYHHKMIFLYYEIILRDFHGFSFKYLLLLLTRVEIVFFFSFCTENLTTVPEMMISIAWEIPGVIQILVYFPSQIINFGLINFKTWNTINVLVNNYI